MPNFSPTEVGPIVRRYTPYIFHHQTRQDKPLLDKSVIKHVTNARKGNVTLTAGRLATNSIKRDYDALERGDAHSRTVLEYDYVSFWGKLELGRIAMKMASETEGRSSVIQEMKLTAKGLNADLSRAILASDMGSPAQVQVSTDTELHIVDWYAFKRGGTYALLDSSYNLKTTFVVSDIAEDATTGAGNGRLDLTAQIGVAVATSDVICLVGALSASQTNFEGLYNAAGTGTVYSAVSDPVYEWEGHVESASTSITPNNIKAHCDLIYMRSGKKPDLIVGTSEQETAILTAQDTLVQIASSATDKFKRSKTFVDGVPFLVANDARRKSLLFLHTDDLALHLAQDFMPAVDGNMSKDGPGAFRNSHSYYTKELEMEAFAQMRIEGRNGLGIWTAASV